MNIQDFARLRLAEQILVLKTEANLIDNYVEKLNLVLVYSLSNFFIEATINPDTEDIIEIIPFKRGFLSNKRYLQDHLRKHILSFAQVA